MNKDKEQALSLVTALLLLAMAQEEQEKRKKELEDLSNIRKRTFLRTFKKRIGDE
jgi:uncharacterized membrane protein